MLRGGGGFFPHAKKLDSIFVLEITTVVFVMMVRIVAMESEQSIGPSELVSSGNSRV